ncbi:MarR family transcriptional regulator [Flavobacteriaceae bacterium]|jgi:MarR family 2-MHQ and catechol resistance regulon transcriptional repressor|nr:MarR family transcriptional regulator [Bacteroidota bacterium]MDA9551762.1 MarR family transcriptional regulator [Flavobacteriaceae bacterium]MDC1052126.1 MarR family transcriptional regulator [Flavobacteriaceae bacterium]MDG1378387.1 MarR family transcriptional regulator [Flavobacteriaceae bacterium]MDG2349352.1 MarR family transcriptional regulator [Flavobacteriaceae bacterium]
MGDLSRDINSKFQSPKQKAVINILYTANWVHSKQIMFFKQFGISPQQFNVLRILRGAKAPLKVQTIKKRMIERAPNVTRLMDKLFSKGLIDRISCKHDRRVVHIVITAKGLHLLKVISRNMKEDTLENLDDEEALILSDLLDKIR